MKEMLTQIYHLFITPERLAMRNALKFYVASRCIMSTNLEPRK